MNENFDAMIHQIRKPTIQIDGDNYTHLWIATQKMPDDEEAFLPLTMANSKEDCEKLITIHGRYGATPAHYILFKVIMEPNP